jgi:peptidoglycan/LPS O-acetylase OafA/YrhL
MPSLHPSGSVTPRHAWCTGRLRFFWEMKETSAFEHRQLPAPLQWPGSWSYSFYLVHSTVLAALARVHGSLSHFVRWPLKLAAILTVTDAFDLAVERPGHWPARLVWQRAWWRGRYWRSESLGT